jgi:hypothetical protein
MISSGSPDLQLAKGPMIGTRTIQTAPRLVFDISAAGAADAPQVLMLHGFCVARYFWHNQMPALADADISRWRRTSAVIRSTLGPTRKTSTITVSTG